MRPRCVIGLNVQSMTVRLLINWILIFGLLASFTLGTIYSVYSGGLGTAYAEAVNANPNSTHFIAFADSPAGNARGIVASVFTSLGNTFGDQFICAVENEQFAEIAQNYSTRDRTMRLGSRTVTVTNVRAADPVALREMLKPDTCRIGNNLSFFFLLFAGNLS